MNRSFRSIWNTSLGAWVAAPEISRACGKPSTGRRSRRADKSHQPVWSLLGASLLFGLSGSSWAYNAGDGANDGTSGQHVSIGSGMGTCTPLGTSQAGQNGYTNSTGGALAKGSNTIAIGTNCAEPAVADGSHAIALGNNTTAIGTDALSLGASAMAKGPSTVAIGANAQADGEQGVALGAASKANVFATGVGSFAQATGNESVALGHTAQATGSAALALGSAAQAKAADSVALGAKSVTAASTPSTAAYLTGTLPNAELSVGNNSLTRRITHVADGADPQDAATVAQLSASSQVLGSSVAQALGDGANYDVSTGQVTSPTYTVYRASGITSNVTNVGAALDQINSSGIKYFHTNSTDVDSAAIGSNAIAVGSGAKAQGSSSVAMGWDSQAVTVNSVALGAQSKTAATPLSGTSFMTDQAQSQQWELSVGNDTNTRRITHVADGVSAQDAVTVAQLSTSHNLLSTGLSSLSTSTSTGLGSLSTGLSTAQSGVGSLSTSLSGMQSGMQAGNQALGDSVASALGGGASYDDATGTVSSPNYAMQKADGSSQTVNSVGDALDAINSEGIRYFHANSTGADSQALGTDAVAIGTDAIASEGNSVAIGAGARTSAAIAVSNVVVGSSSFGGFAGANPVGVFSVGAAGAERQIQHVAAGRVSDDSTDAINGSQLYQVASATDANTQSIGSLSTGLSTTNSGLASLSTSTSTGLGSLSTGLSTAQSGVGSLSTSLSGMQSGMQAGNQALGDSVASALGGGASYDDATGTVSSPNYAMQKADGSSQTVNSVGDALDAINSEGIRYFHANSTGADSQALGTDAVAIGTDAIASEGNSVAIGAGARTSAAIAVSNVVVGSSSFGGFAGANPVGVFSVGAAGAERQIQHVAAGRVSDDSTDAINGSQLYQVASATDANTQSIGSLSTGLSTTNSGLASLSTSTSTGLGSLSTGLSTAQSGVGSLSTSLSGMQSGMQAGNQALGDSVASALGGGASYDDATGTVSSPNYAMQKADGSSQTVNSVGDALDAINSEGIRYFHANSTGVDSQALGTDAVAIGTDAIASEGNSVAIGAGARTSAATAVSNVVVGSSSFGGFAGANPVGVFSVGAAGAERQIQHVAAGRVSDDSTDAINGSQLYQVASATDANTQSIGSLSTGLSTTNSGLASLSTGLGWVTGELSSLSTSTAGGMSSLSTGLDQVNNGMDQINNGLSSLSTVTGQSVGSLSTGLSSLSTAIDNIGSTDVHLGDLGQGVADSLGGGAQWDDSTGSLSAPSYTLSQADGSSSTVHSVGDTLQMLNEQGTKYVHTNSQAAGAVATGQDASALGAESVASGNNSLAMGHGAHASGEQATAIGWNAVATAQGGVALGSGSMASREAGVAGYVGRGASAAQTQAVAATTSTAGAVAVGDADSGTLRQVTGVAAGSADTDAVNVAQLKSVGGSVNLLKGDVDGMHEQIGALQTGMNETRRVAYSGVAMAMAMSGSFMPNPDPGRHSMGVGMGTFEGQSAMAMNYKQRSDDGRMTWGAGVSSTGTQWGLNAGFGWTW